MTTSDPTMAIPTMAIPTSNLGTVLWIFPKPANSGTGRKAAVATTTTTTTTTENNGHTGTYKGTCPNTHVEQLEKQA